MYQNNVELLDFMGSDKSHAMAAWASTFFELGIELPKDPKIRVDQIVDHILSKSKRMRSIEDLLNYLAKENHESPFRMSRFVFGMTTDIATHIQKLKHAVILEAENAESAKYKELKEDKFYMPEDWKNFGTTGEKWYGILEQESDRANRLYHEAYHELKNAGMPLKRVKETARYFKMYNSQMNSVNKLSFAGVMQFHHKRTVDFSQEEIKDVANGMVNCIREIPGEPFKESLKAFGLW